MTTFTIAPLSTRETIVQVYETFGNRDVRHDGALPFLVHLATAIDTNPEPLQWIKELDFAKS